MQVVEMRTRSRLHSIIYSIIRTWGGTLQRNLQNSIYIEMDYWLKHTDLQNSVNHMLQGVTCLMAYNDSIQGRDCYEAEYVIASCNILKSYLGRQKYSISVEYPYRNLINDDTTREEADLVIIEKETGIVLCVMEFKLSSNTNGGVYKDINKMQRISKDIDRLAILLCQKPFEKKGDFVTEKNNAKKGGVLLLKNSYLEQDTRVFIRRVYKVLRSPKSKNPYMTICIEV